ncbi:MAG: DUF3034 family protein [Planctomycetota bacterium]
MKRFKVRWIAGMICVALFGAGAGSAGRAADGPPPLPFHQIDGAGGGAITPMAYLVNPSTDGCMWGKPAMALSYVNLGTKNLDAITVSETLWGRVELSYGADRLYFGSLPSLVNHATGMDMGCASEWLHSFNVRYMVLQENKHHFMGLPLPAVTAGVSFKYNEGIENVDRRLAGSLTAIGYRRPNGEDFTLTATKTIPEVLGRPLIVTGGLRLSEAAQTGFLGFSDTYRASFEGNIVFPITERLLVAYEYRQKHDPYGQIPGIILGEDDWHALDVALILNNQSSLTAGWGNFGRIADEVVNGAWWLQYKFEF